jgi:predicted TPR repeat methyltransferase
MAQLDPNEVAWLNDYYKMGLTYQKHQDYLMAKEVYLSILAVLPAHLGARFHLGCLYLQTDAFTEAVKIFEAIVADHPDQAESFTNLGNAYLRLENPEAARKAYASAIQMNPEDTQALFNLGVLAHKVGEAERAIDYYQRLLAIEPMHSDAHINIGAIYWQLRQRDEAIAHYEAAKQLRPDDALIEHALAVVRGDPAATRMPDAYARALFDEYADIYDEHLLQALQYQVPTHLTQLLARLGLTPSADWQALDLGCGTGLCAEVIKPFAKHLAGLDLSSNMLAKAKQKALYDELIEAEAYAYLANQREVYDLVLAADMFVYIGELQPLLSRIYTALKPGAWLIFTIETGGTGEALYTIQASGRYCHDSIALLQVGQQLGFEAVATANVVLRQNAGQPVYGMLAAWRKRMPL